MFFNVFGLNRLKDLPKIGELKNQNLNASNKSGLVIIYNVSIINWKMFPIYQDSR